MHRRRCCPVGCLASLAVVALLAGITKADSNRKNVILFISDDLRPQLNQPYGQSHMITPNFDAFSKQALVFDRAYTNFAICSASRNSFLTGRRPDRTRVWNFINHFRQGGVSKTGRPGQEWTTLPEFFKNQGYATLGHGKTYHPNKPPNWDEPNSWSQTQKYYPPTNSACSPNHAGGATDTRFCPDGESPPEAFSDLNVTNEAIDTLQHVADAFKSNGTNFFLALGLHYPHQTWHVPLDVVNQYPAATDLPPPKYPFAPKGCPDVAFTAELDGDPNMDLNEDLPGFKNSKPANVSGVIHRLCPWPGNNSIPTWMQQQLRLGYYSAVTLTDRHFGMLMSKLDEAGLANDTLVVVASDHGWQLGEHAEWGKHTNFDLAVHVPLMVRAPWAAQSSGKHTQSFFELVDLYRTMVGLAGLDSSKIEDDVEGIDQSSLIHDPRQVLKNVSFAQYSRCPGNRYWPKKEPGHPDWYMNNCENVPSQNISYMGYTVRVKDFRYTVWYSWNGTSCSAEWSKGPYGRELYSHEGEASYPVDFDSFENENVVNNAKYSSMVTALQKMIEDQFRPTKPTSCPPPLSPSPGPTPNPHNALILQRSSIHQDNCLCGTHQCLSKNPQFNYTDVSTEGYMPGAGSQGTIALTQYWNANATDNLLTTLAPPSGYDKPSNLNPAGQIFKDQPSALLGKTVPLLLYYNKQRQDHLTCALDSTVKWAEKNGYAQVATLGYVFTDPQEDAALELI